ncbi:glycoside hydrolase family 32 protein [Cellulomonas uda]|uniref:Beta-fructosidase levanase/invertase n=1 Tax=Cellulomonas uda TaxID=1714 RepID=A0A4Y3KGV2_CELUD|nr:glycoside hydrolase family 32 protein [Cellulomonas uda]NII66920.1 sucrose-6-phosphate hydrolase SacC (GH32 family) [Cellulomonas uda]GEA82170.1 beta-fructosidase levanase/invertase [Cellulomonas uda]
MSWPVAHFTTGGTWMNDPNGLVHRDGVWHLFMQHNPHGDDWGAIGWGHATSRDLVTWRWEGHALPATPDEMAFSGCVVSDRLDTAGFARDDDGPAGPMVAVFTSHHAPSSPRAGTETQSLAVSHDEGRTFARWAGNPVIDVGRQDSRDPQVRWDPGARHWRMALADPRGRRVELWTSPDLRAWRQVSTFGPHGSVEGQWECPDLVRVPVAGGDSTAWVLLVNVDRGGPTGGGSATQYVVGEFDGITFTAAHDDIRWLDRGHDHYAAVTFADAPGGRAVSLGWAGSWLYARDLRGEPWGATMTLARDLELVPESPGAEVRSLADLVVRSVPVLPAGPLPGLAVHRVRVARAERRELVLHARQDPALRLGVRVEGGPGERLLVVDRARCAPAAVPPEHHRAAVALPDRDVDLLVVADAGVVEVFADEGRIALTEQVTRRAVLSELAG